MLAEGLHLSRDRGLIVADVAPDGPADKAGLKVQDEISALDDNAVDVLPQFATYLFDKRADDSVKLDVRRGSTHLTLNIPVVDSDTGHDDPLEVIDTESSFVPRLGISLCSAESSDSNSDVTASLQFWSDCGGKDG